MRVDRNRLREIWCLFLGFARFGGDLLSHVLRRSTIGATALNGRVRNGAGCFARAMTTKPSKTQNAPSERSRFGARQRICVQMRVRTPFTFQERYKSTSLSKCTHLCMLLILFRQSQEDLSVTGSNQAYRAISTGQLNALLRLHLRPIDVVVFHGPQGYLVLRGASRLDAFSGYPVRS